MNYRTLTADDFARLASETRDLRQWEASDGSAAILWGSHPIHGRIAMVLDGERYGLTMTSTPAPSLPLPGRPSCPLRQVGPQWASLAALAGMIAGTADFSA